MCMLILPVLLLYIDANGQIILLKRYFPTKSVNALVMHALGHHCSRCSLLSSVLIKFRRLFAYWPSVGDKNHLPEHRKPLKNGNL